MGLQLRRSDRVTFIFLLKGSCASQAAGCWASMMGHSAALHFSVTMYCGPTARAAFIQSLQEEGKPRASSHGSCFCSCVPVTLKVWLDLNFFSLGDLDWQVSFKWRFRHVLWRGERWCPGSDSGRDVCVVLPQAGMPVAWLTPAVWWGLALCQGEAAAGLMQWHGLDDWPYFPQA